MKESDAIIDEVRTIRDAIAKQYHYDIAEIAESIRQRQAMSGRTYVCLAPRTPARIETEPSEAELPRRSA